MLIRLSSCSNLLTVIKQNKGPIVPGTDLTVGLRINGRLLLDVSTGFKPVPVTQQMAAEQTYRYCFFNLISSFS